MCRFWKITSQRKKRELGELGQISVFEVTGVAMGFGAADGLFFFVLYFFFFQFLEQDRDDGSRVGIYIYSPNSYSLKNKIPLSQNPPSPT